jgi:metal-responsive CopG/Arc/MetJ family transcriptional regulator
MGNKKKYIKSVALAVSVDEHIRDILDNFADRRKISRATLINEMITDYLIAKGELNERPN